MNQYKRYDHLATEKKWQKKWTEKKLFQANVDPSKPKYYILDMFPYPSGAGLHVGHVTGYTATDILARYKRQKGFNVLHPMGWDSFGLPAEQYAIRTGTHPRVTTEKSIKTYKRQLQSLGFSYDWSKEIATSDPKYYKWTQWIFTKLYEKGLAYQADMLVNFCPHLGTVLSNEEVEDGKSKEGGYPVHRKPLKQWVLKITDYAEKLLNDLDTLDWPDHLKKLQRNWIGKSEGVSVVFEIDGSGEKLEVFTTRVDTICGVSFLAISPEHPFCHSLTTKDNDQKVKAYLDEVSKKTDLERTELAKEKTGVFTGSYAIHPITKKLVPIWIADYVLMGYGTGIVMGVPSGDERDFEFTKTYNLDVLPVLDPQNFLPEDGEVTRQQILKGEAVYSGKEGVVINSSSGEFSLDGLPFKQAADKALEFLEKSHLAKRTISYKLRDWLFSRQRYWAEPFPILHFEDGSKRVLELDELPLVAPELTDFKPSGDGQSPLAKIDDWVHIKDPKTKKDAMRETNTMPQWAGSCWYYLRFCDPTNDKKAWSEEAENYWMPVDIYVGGVEHAVLHLLYARFWHKVLFDLELVSTKEPFQSLRNQGLVTAKAYKKPSGGYVSFKDVIEKDGQFFDKNSSEKLQELVEKMSKSKLNGVSPDELIEAVGADALRLYEMFMAPFDKEKLWNYEAITGCRRFLNRFFDLVISDKLSEESDEKSLSLAHKLVAYVEEDIIAMQFNTAIAKMMEFLNDFSKLESYSKEALIMAIKALYPFAPHFAEECYELLGGTDSLTYQKYPTHDPKYLSVTNVTYVIQVNGKVRGRFEMEKDLSQDEVLSNAKQLENIQKHIEGKTIFKEIYVPNKLLNILVK